MTEKYRGDHIGSLLRPEPLLAARRGHDAGEVSDADLRETEDQAITVTVLGLVSSKTGVLEPADTLRARIDEAAKYAEYDDLALSPQCGFASIAEGGNLLTEDQQYAKLALVADVARAVWSE